MPSIRAGVGPALPEDRAVSVHDGSVRECRDAARGASSPIAAHQTQVRAPCPGLAHHLDLRFARDELRSEGIPSDIGLDAAVVLCVCGT